ncbi:MAG: adenosylcobinamide-GDP ribazoletransferase, partial [Actinomycetota bacterium]|nr:adenosylcobinamide-GDP ribazoletransferase [Actinomycetota bacterium]
RGRAITGGVVAVAITALATGWWVGPLVAVALGAAAIVAVVARRAFGGVTGDHLGAIEQVVECLVLVTVTGLATHHHLWWP